MNSVNNLFLEKSIYTIIIAITFFDFIITYLGFPKILSWTPTIIIVCLIIYRGMKNTQDNNQQIKTPRFLFRVLLFLFLIGLYSKFINASPILSLILTYRKYFPYFLLFVILIDNCPSLNTYLRVLKLIFFVALVQIPVSIVEYNIFGKGDLSGGTLGLDGHGTGIIAIFIPALMGYLFSLGQNTNKHIKLLPFQIILFIPLLLGEAKAAFLFIPLTIIIQLVYILFSNLSAKKILKLAVIAIGALIIFIKILILSPKYFENEWAVTMFSEPSKTLEVLTSQDLIFDDTFPGGYRMERIGSVVYSYLYIDQKGTQTLLFGLGPGNTTSSYIEAANGAYATQIPVVQTAIVLFLLEWGIIGTLFHISIFIYAIWKTHKVINAIRNSRWKSLAQGIQGFYCISFIAVIYNAVLFYDLIGFLFWFLLSLIFVIEKNIDIINSNNINNFADRIIPSGVLST